VDGLIPQGAQALASYQHPRFGDFPAVTTQSHGSGRITVVGCVPSPGLAKSIVRWAVPDAPSSRLAGEVERPLTISSGSLPDGRRVWFVFNWGWESRNITLAQPVSETCIDAAYEAGTELSLGAWSTRTFISQ
jgi:beta-galactosidase